MTIIDGLHLLATLATFAGVVALAMHENARALASTPQAQPERDA